MANEPGQTLILFADDVELRAFQERVTAYNGEKAENQKNQPCAALNKAIEAVRTINAADRIGPVLRREGYDNSDDIPEPVESYDVELWPVSDFTADLFIHRVILGQQGGTLVSYRGNSALLMRVQASGPCIRSLLELPEVAAIDRPPTPDWPELPAGEIEPKVAAADRDALTIAVIDSGLTSAHPLIAG
ncbi:hypothetical protein [Bradyrhizobium sp. CCGB01]|uniref:hypothetical protein n=1 Tax=Bradyrhizobium sp. CCGB01 TaxID=2949634 RepID=UPI0020B1848B|nr:hypothetical protein [Bradyrhizobium sp. CCGB01]MCP3405697.1 hypothetical protein [Bradyrhizobium sp. CCGB01]